MDQTLSRREAEREQGGSRRSRREQEGSREEQRGSREVLPNSPLLAAAP
jgi:hypothetical protein